MVDFYDIAKGTIQVEIEQRKRTPHADHPLETIHDGQGRHYALFDNVRFRAYGDIDGFRDRGSLDRWIAHVKRIAFEHNARFPEPKAHKDVVKLAYSVSTWVWDGGGPLDHSPRSAKAPAGSRAERFRREKNRDRDAAIKLTDGRSNAEIAEKFGLSVRQVRRLRNQV